MSHVVPTFNWLQDAVGFLQMLNGLSHQLFLAKPDVVNMMHEEEMVVPLPQTEFQASLPRDGNSPQLLPPPKKSMLRKLKKKNTSEHKRKKETEQVQRIRGIGRVRFRRQVLSRTALWPESGNHFDGCLQSKIRK